MTLQIKGDDYGLIFHRMMRGSLTIGHDGSYMPMAANNVCLCAVVIYCSHNKKYAEVTWVEKRSKQSANKYRAKILGGCCAQLLVKATITGHNIQGLATPKYGCNNIGVVLHGTHHRQPLLEIQAQSDVLRYFKNLVSTSQIGSKMYHIYGHTNQHLHQLQMSLAQQVKVRADKLASSALMEALTTQTFIRSLSSSKGVSLKIGETRITNCLRWK